MEKLKPGIYKSDNTLIRKLNCKDFKDFNSFNGLLEKCDIIDTDLTVVTPKVTDEPDELKNIFFDKCESIKEIHMENSDILFDCYLCKNLETVYLPDNLTEYDIVTAFTDSKGLKSLYIDKNNKYFTTINGALYNKKVTKLIHYPAKCTSEFASGLKTLGMDSLFDYNEEILRIPYGVTKLEENSLSFSAKDKTISIFIPDSVESIEPDFADGATQLIIYCSNRLKEMIDERIDIDGTENAETKVMTLDVLLDENLNLPMTEINDYLKDEER